mgnify:CR=1 FL=1
MVPEQNARTIYVQGSPDTHRIARAINEIFPLETKSSQHDPGAAREKEIVRDTLARILPSSAIKDILDAPSHPLALQLAAPESWPTASRMRVIWEKCHPELENRGLLPRARHLLLQGVVRNPADLARTLEVLIFAAQST